MLRITVPSTGESQLTFATFERYNLPGPPNGMDAEINGDLILKFEDEKEALTYAGQLENLSNGLDNKSSEPNLAISDIIMAIRNDEFVRTYNE
jgi:hypothetical protein